MINKNVLQAMGCNFGIYIKDIKLTNQINGKFILIPYTEANWNNVWSLNRLNKWENKL